MDNKNLDSENKNEELNENNRLIEDILKAKDKANKEKSEIFNNEKEKENSQEISEQNEVEEDSYITENGIAYEKEIKPEKNRKKKKKKRSHKRLCFVLILAIIIVSIAIVAAAYIIKIGKDAFGIDKSNEYIEINIPQGSTTTDISQILFDNDIIEEPLVFKLFSRLQHADSLYKDGTHTLQPNMSYETIISELQKESVKDTVDVTFPEGYTIYQCADVLEENGVCNADDFILIFNSESFGFDFENEVSNNPLKFCKMEGFLFPDTYRFYLDSEPEVVVKKIFTNFSEKIDQNMLGRMEELNMTLEQTIILASIVQGEAPESYEMKNVASVFMNRLNNAEEYPLLQSDATTKYVNQTIIPNNKVENENMCIAYDTYQGQGLPPGAICNPGIDAINAVLYYNDTDYFYFCSNLETREFFYSKTLSEHENNLVKAGLK